MMQRLREAVSVVKDILPVASAFAMVLGTTIIVSNSARLGYFPTGISAGDALFFLCLSMLVSASYLLAAYAFFSVTLFFCSVVRPVHNWLRKQREKEFTHYIPSKPIEGEVESALAGIDFLVVTRCGTD